jgi:hypothetical protein
VVIGLGAGGYYFLRTPIEREAPITQTVPPGPATTTTPPPPTPPASPAQPATLGTLRVDALPWATVSIRPLSEGIQLETKEYTTPFSVQLPRGEYEVRFGNPQYKSPEATKVKVTDKPVELRVTMRGFDPERALDAILAEPSR